MREGETRPSRAARTSTHTKSAESVPSSVPSLPTVKLVPPAGEQLVGVERVDRLRHLRDALQDLVAVAAHEALRATLEAELGPDWPTQHGIQAPHIHWKGAACHIWCGM